MWLGEGKGLLAKEGTRNRPSGLLAAMKGVEAPWVVHVDRTKKGNGTILLQHVALDSQRHPKLLMLPQVVMRKWNGEAYPCIQSLCRERFGIRTGREANHQL